MIGEKALLPAKLDKARTPRGAQVRGTARLKLRLRAGERSESMSVRRPREIKVDEPFALCERMEIEAIAIADINLFGVKGRDRGEGWRDRCCGSRPRGHILRDTY